MTQRKEAKEVKAVKEAEGKDLRVAAFFDLDGTLLPLPSLERRFFRMLRYRKEIPLKNYFLWLAEALRLLPSGLGAIVHGNKMYLRGVLNLNWSGGFTSPAESGAENFDDFSAHKVGRPSKFGASQAGGQASAIPPKRERRNPRCTVPHFLEEAVERVVWHAKQGHVIALVSGTLEPLANIAAQALEAELAARGLAAKVHVCATRVEEIQGRWTGKVVGEAIFEEAKARAAKRLAEEMQLDLANSFAYGDSANDRWLLAAVGHPAVVNPSRRLLHFARRRNLPVLRWGKEKEVTQRTQRRETAAQTVFIQSCTRKTETGFA